MEYILEMPPEDADRERQYTMPFYADRIFKYHLKPINNLFFSPPPNSSTNQSLRRRESSVKGSSMEMVYMTPDSDSDSDEGRLAADDIFLDEEEKEDAEDVQITGEEKSTDEE